MSTRKLILTALLCGLAILVAGGVKLLQVAQETDKVTILPLGEDATLGDMTVSVLSVTGESGRTVVTVRMAGVEGADALEGWRMLAEGKVSGVSDGPWSALAMPACGLTSRQGSTCALVFPAADGTVTIAYLRAGAQSQWSQAA